LDPDHDGKSARTVIVGLIGAGNMAGALARGWAAASAGPDKMVFSDADSERSRLLAEEVAGRAAASNREVAESSDVIVLAMKPGALAPVAEDVRVPVAERHVPVVSILGATRISALEQALGPGTAVLRFMPNVAAAVRQGTLCYASGAALDERTERDLLDLFGLLGELVPVEERLMDAATAISGCGPAFMALVVEALTDAGVEHGLTAAQASRLAVSTMGGSAALLAARRDDAPSVRRQVTSPGGVTAAGLAALERSGVRAAFADAVDAVVIKAEAARAEAAQAPPGGNRSR
jgi:pyrroline-5-carboxylate reductase